MLTIQHCGLLCFCRFTLKSHSRDVTTLHRNLVKAAGATWQKLGEGFAKKLIYQTHVLMSYANKKCYEGSGGKISIDPADTFSKDNFLDFVFHIL